MLPLRFLSCARLMPHLPRGGFSGNQLRAILARLIFAIQHRYRVSSAKTQPATNQKAEITRRPIENSRRAMEVSYQRTCCHNPRILLLLLVPVRVGCMSVCFHWGLTARSMLPSSRLDLASVHFVSTPKADKLSATGPSVPAAVWPKQAAWCTAAAAAAAAEEEERGLLIPEAEAGRSRN